MRTPMLRPVLALLLLLTACGGDGSPTGPGDGDGDGVTLVNGTFSGTLNGSAYSPISAFALFTPPSGQGGGGILSFGSGDLQGRALGMAVLASTPGTYTMNMGTASNAYYTEGNGSSAWAAGAGSTGTGTVIITTLTTSRVVASFTFNLVPVEGSASGTRTLVGEFDLTPIAP